MKALNIACCMLLCLAMISCEKAFVLTDPNNPGGGSSGGGNGNLLAKAALTGPGFSMSTSYDYDGAGRLIRTTDLVPNVMTGQMETLVERFVRDAGGRIIKTISNKTTDGQKPGFKDSVIIELHYPSATSAEFDYSINTNPDPNLLTRDSTVYTYTNGLIASTITYGGSASPVFYGPATYKYEYTYDANGNITVAKQYMLMGSGSSLALGATQTNTFDDKVNPLQRGNEGLIGGGIVAGTGKNNVLTGKREMHITAPPFTTTSTSVYKYDASGKPLSATSTDSQAPSQPSTITYTYK